MNLGIIVIIITLAKDQFLTACVVLSCPLQCLSLYMAVIPEAIEPISAVEGKG